MVVNKKVLVFSFAFILAMSFLFNLGVVSAVEPFDTIGESIGKVLGSGGGWTGGKLDPNVARWAFFVLLALLFWSALDYAPFFKEGVGKKISWIVAIMVAYLAMAYITPEEVFITLTSYTTLGIVLGGALPFIILAFFSMKIHQEGGLGGKLLAKFLWFAFIIFLIARLIPIAFGNTPNGLEGSVVTYAWAYLIMIALAIGWIWKFEKWLIHLVFKEETAEGIKNRLEMEKNRLVDELRTETNASLNITLAKSRQAQAGKRAAELQDKLVELNKEIAKWS